MWANPARLAHGRVQQRMTEEFVARPRSALACFASTIGTIQRRWATNQRRRHLRTRWVEELRGLRVERRGAPMWTCSVIDPGTSRVVLRRVGRSSLPWMVMLGVAMDHADVGDGARTEHRPWKCIANTTGEPPQPEDSRRLDPSGEGHEAERPRRSWGWDRCRWFPPRSKPDSASSASTARSSTDELGSSFRLAAVLTDAPLRSPPRSRFVRSRRVLRGVSGLHRRLPARRDQPPTSGMVRGRDQVGGRFRPMPPVLRPELWLRDLHRGLPLVETGCWPTPVGCKHGAQASGGGWEPTEGPNLHSELPIDLTGADQA